MANIVTHTLNSVLQTLLMRRTPEPTADVEDYLRQSGMISRRQEQDMRLINGVAAIQKDFDSLTLLDDIAKGGGLFGWMIPGRGQAKSDALEKVSQAVAQQVTLHDDPERNLSLVSERLPKLLSNSTYVDLIKAARHKPIPLPELAVQGGFLDRDLKKAQDKMDAVHTVRSVRRMEALSDALDGKTRRGKRPAEVLDALIDDVLRHPEMTNYKADDGLRNAYHGLSILVSGYLHAVRGAEGDITDEAKDQVKMLVEEARKEAYLSLADQGGYMRYMLAWPGAMDRSETQLHAEVGRLVEPMLKEMITARARALFEARGEEALNHLRGNAADFIRPSVEESYKQMALYLRTQVQDAVLVSEVRDIASLLSKNYSVQVSASKLFNEAAKAVIQDYPGMISEQAISDAARQQRIKASEMVDNPIRQGVKRVTEDISAQAEALGRAVNGRPHATQNDPALFAKAREQEEAGRVVDIPTT